MSVEVHKKSVCMNRGDKISLLEFLISPSMGLLELVVTMKTFKNILCMLSLY